MKLYTQNIQDEMKDMKKINTFTIDMKLISIVNILCCYMLYFFDNVTNMALIIAIITKRSLFFFGSSD